MGKEKFLIFFLFLIFIILLSLFKIKKTKEKEDYFLAGRNLNFLFLFFTILSTSIGSSSTILLFYLTSKYGILGLSLEIGGGLGLIVLGIFFSKRLKSSNAFSLPEFLGQSFGKKIRFLISILVLISEILWLSLIFKAIQTIIFFEILFFHFLILIFIFLISISGLWGIAFTDIFYCLLIFLSFLSSYLFNYFKINNEIFFEKINLKLLFFLFFSTFLTHLAGSDIWGKVFASKSARDAKIGTVLAGLGKIFWAILIFLIVLKFKPTPEGDKTLLSFSIFLPKFYFFLILLGILSALLSSANSLLITASTVLSNDIFPAFKKRKTFTFFLGLIAFFISILSPDLLFLFKRSYGFFALTISVPSIIALLTFELKKFKKSGII